MKLDLSRFKNYGLWVAILSFVTLLSQTYGVFTLPENFQQLGTTVLSIFVALGFINNPTTENKGFFDDRQ